MTIGDDNDDRRDKSSRNDCDDANKGVNDDTDEEGINRDTPLTLKCGVDNAHSIACLFTLQ